MKVTPQKQSGIRPQVFFAALAIAALIAAVAGAVWMSGREKGDETAALDDADGAPEDDEDDFFDFSGAASGDRAGGTSAGSTGTGAAPAPLAPLPERLRARIQLAPLGAREPTLTPEQLVATLQQHRGALRECVRQAGGFRALRGGASAAGDAPAGTGAPAGTPVAGAEGGRPRGPRVRPQMRFDVGPDGRVVAGSVSIEPAVPEAFSSCVAETLGAISFPAPGGDGVRAELPLGVGRGGGRRRPDGGVGRVDPTARPARRPDGDGRASGGATVPALAPPSGPSAIPAP